MSNDVRTESRLSRVKVEVVSGGTQAEETPQATRTTMIVGALAWLALFVVLAFYSLWFVVFILGLAVSIMLHELGHFWTARRSGMRATQFFLGFGPRVWSTHRNGVEYGVRAIPLGGFVKIIGMTNIDEVAEEDEPHTYRQGSYPRRMWVITAGSVMHMIIAVVLIVIVFMAWGRVEEVGRVTLAEVTADSPAAAAGLRNGDIIVTANGDAVTEAGAFRDILSSTPPGEELTLEVLRDGTPLTIAATLIQNPSTEEVRGYLGVFPVSDERVQQSFGEAIVDGPSDLVEGVGQAIVGVAKVINPISVFGHLTGTNDDPTSKPGTIVGATKISDDIGEFDGWAGMLSLLAGLNVSVGVFNMFPLMPLDGGHAAIATYERIRSRKGKRYYADVNKLMPVAAMCIALLAFMFLTGLYLDIAKS
jgi:membrane-associated protease RseP (regulator of RpoE activity)